MIDAQPTQPLSALAPRHSQEKEDRYQRLMRLSQQTGKRLLFVYLEEKKKAQQYERGRNINEGVPLLHQQYPQSNQW